MQRLVLTEAEIEELGDVVLAARYAVSNKAMALILVHHGLNAHQVGAATGQRHYAVSREVERYLYTRELPA